MIRTPTVPAHQTEATTRSAAQTIALVAICLGYSLFFANNLLLPLWLQEHMGYTATWAGLVAAPSGIVAVALTPIVSRFKLDQRIIASFAFLLFAASYFLRSGYTPDASYWSLTWPLLLQGAAMSMFFVPMITISLDGIPGERVPSASGISNFARITSSGFAASIVTSGCRSCRSGRAATRRPAPSDHVVAAD